MMQRRNLFRLLKLSFVRERDRKNADWKILDLRISPLSGGDNIRCGYCQKSELKILASKTKRIIDGEPALKISE